MKGHRLMLISWAVLVAVLTAWTAIAGQPADHLRQSVDRALSILRDPALRGPDRAVQRRQALRTVSDGVFDWPEMARRTLGRHWERRSAAEQQEFTRALSDLIERSWADRLERYQGERVLFAGETVEGELATVRTKVADQHGRDIAVDYRMIRRDERWLVFDVVIENVSLVNNYRTQFDAILRTASYRELLQRIQGGRS